MLPVLCSCTLTEECKRREHRVVPTGLTSSTFTSKGPSVLPAVWLHFPGQVPFHFPSDNSTFSSPSLNLQQSWAPASSLWWPSFCFQQSCRGRERPPIAATEPANPCAFLPNAVRSLMLWSVVDLSLLLSKNPATLHKISFPLNYSRILSL